MTDRRTSETPQSSEIPGKSALPDPAVPAVPEVPADADSRPDVPIDFGLGYGQAAAKVREFPAGPGVYLMKDSLGRVIYVGKAKSLRSRAGSYFLKAAAEDRRTAELVRGYFVLESLGHPDLKGTGRPIEVLRVSAETSARSRLDVMLSRGLIPMVGRDR